MNQAPTILIIFGISGDLSKRKLLPAIGKLATAGKLPEKFKIIGVTRRPDLETTKLLEKVPNNSFLYDHLSLFQMDINEKNEYEKLAAYLGKLETEMNMAAQTLFYLSVPPEAVEDIVKFIGISSLNHRGTAKLLLEKPFGTNLASANKLVEHIDGYFKPEQVYRIDHYLAKEMAQNLVTFRASNPLFLHTWNKDFIKQIEITASENIGIEGRVNFYEQTGALRDIVQSHLLQLAALTLMEMPKYGSLEEVPKMRFAALKKLSLAVPARRAQYESYRADVKNPESTVETFVSLILKSIDPRWTNVPIILNTGKALEQKLTQIKITYQPENGHEPNELTLRLQPDEGVELCLWTKRPGYEKEIEKHPLKFTYKDHYSDLPEAYEQVLYDAINSDHSLFTTSGEVLESWRILDPVQKAWAASDKDLAFYKSGSQLSEVLAKFK